MYFTIFLITQILISETISGKVVKVKDGDTIDILIGKTIYVLRLEGIDAPENDQDFSSKSKQFVSDFCFGKTVRAEYKEKDRYRRYLAKVYINDKCLNEELLRTGMAWHYKYFNKEARLANLEDYARKNRIGLWSHPNPIPPWEFRKRKSNRRK